jgi:hypothetical protein
LIAREKVFLPINRQMRRPGTRRHDNRASGVEQRVSNGHLRAADEPCRLLKRDNPGAPAAP